MLDCKVSLFPLLLARNVEKIALLLYGHPLIVSPHRARPKAGKLGPEDYPKLGLSGGYFRRPG